MTVRRFAGERWWGGYAIHLEEGGDGYHSRLRRELNFHAPPEPSRWSSGPFASLDAAHEAAVLHIIDLERHRPAADP